ncbi:MAG: DMT family transporter [Ruminococcaceae bacterium]|nr:DMT family transporter [Oscillospiraceae bacterium]
MRKVRSTVFLALTAMIWGFAFVAQLVGADYLRPFTFNGIRFVMGAVSLIPVILLFERGRSSKKELSATVKYGVLAGTVLFVAANLQQFGVEFTTSASKPGFLTGLYTVLVPIIYFIFMKRKTGFNVWVGAIFTVCGLYLLCAVGESAKFGIGETLLIIGAVLWALHIIILDRYADAVRPLRFSMVQFAVCGVLTIICAVIFERDVFEIANVKAALLPLLYGGLGSVGIAYTCQLLGQKDADPTMAAIILSTEAVFSAIGEAIILGKYMDAPGYIGCALIFVGIVLSQIPTEVFRKIFKKA